MFTKSILQISKIIEVNNDLSPFHHIEVSGVCIDTRKLQQGNLFIPFVGEQVDGHSFVEDALANGAAASLWQKDVPNPPLHLPVIIVDDTLQAIQQLAKSYRDELNVKVIGVTGSNGKTTTKDIIYELLATKYQVHKTMGNYNNHLGLPLTILDIEADTEYAVLEMGMSGKGEIEFLTKLARPETVVITNIGESHLLHLGSRQGIAEAKLEIINGLGDDGLIVYFGDEPLLRQGLSNYDGNANLITFGREQTNDIFIVEKSSTDRGCNFTINKSSEQLYLPVLGTYNLLNALAAIAVAQNYGVEIRKIKEALAKVTLTNMRMELVESACGAKIINDAYNASPTSMYAAIDLIANLPDFKTKIVVLGDILELGPEEVEYHLNIGKSLDPEKITFLFTYGKLAMEIGKGASENFPPERIFSFVNKTDLINQLANILTGEEIVLVKGSRGMRLEEVVTALT